MTKGIHPLPGKKFIVPDDPRLADLPAPTPGAGYLAKFGPLPLSKEVWVNPSTQGANAGTVWHITAGTRANVITVWMEFAAELAALRRQVETRRLAYAASPSATSAGGVVAEMEALDAPR